MALQLRTHYRRVQLSENTKNLDPDQQRIQRKLEKQRLHYLNLKTLKQPPWGNIIRSILLS